MNTISNNPETFESTYALLIRSEEKQRSRVETLIYTVLIASAMFAVSQFGRQAVMLPAHVGRSTAIVTSASRHGA